LCLIVFKHQMKENKLQSAPLQRANLRKLESHSERVDTTI